MKQEAVDYALEEGWAEAQRNLLSPCAFAKGVRVFLEEIADGARWWEEVIIGLVLRLVDQAITRCEQKGGV